MNYSQAAGIAFKILSAKLLKRRIPFQMHVRVTDECNSHCSYCREFYRINHKIQPSTQQLFDLVEGCSKLGTKRITLLGGEALLRADIDEVIAKIKSCNISCSLTTNGYSLNRHINGLKKLDQVSVSIDGDKISHDTYRGSGSWDTAVNAIKTARSYGIPVQLMVTITNLTDCKAVFLTKLARELDCFIDFNILFPIANNDGTVTLRPEEADEHRIRLLFDNFIINKDPRVVYSPYVLKYIRDWPFSPLVRLSRKEIPSFFKPLKCYGGYFSAFIDSNGELLPCSLYRPDYKASNVFESGMESAWEKMPESLCITCRSSGYCMFSAAFSFHIGTLIHILGLISRGW